MLYYRPYYNIQLRSSSLDLLKLCYIHHLLSADELAIFKHYSKDVSDSSFSWGVTFGIGAVIIATLLFPLPFYSKALYLLIILVISASFLLLSRQQKIKKVEHAVHPTSLDKCDHSLHLQQLFASKTRMVSFSSSAAAIDPSKPAEIEVGDV